MATTGECGEPAAEKKTHPEDKWGKKVIEAGYSRIPEVLQTHSLVHHWISSDFAALPW
jgi:hypothetical protein